MKTQTRYEEIILDEIRKLPSETLPYAFKMLRSLRGGLSTVSKNQLNTGQDTGFCGKWQDDRSAEEIISDIQACRSGFGSRDIEL